MRLVVDTNIIISALIRDSLTRKALLYPYFEFFAPEDIRTEIGRNMDEIVHKSGVPLEIVSEVLDTLFERVELIPFRDFSGHYKEAHECMKGIDEDDAPFLALALYLDGDGIWSNDAHLREQGLVRVWTTAEVLEELGSREVFS